MDFSLKLHIISTCALIGLIWIVQIVHYPSFYFVEDKRFVEFESFHKKSITLRKNLNDAATIAKICNLNASQSKMK